MTWSDIEGWCNFEDVYDKAVEDAKSGDVLIELGVCWGRSLAYLARKAIDSQKLLRVIGVDHWNATDIVRFEAEMKQHAPDEREFVSVWHMNTVAAAERARKAVEGGASFVFIDADHSYAGVKADIAAWKTLVRPGGMLAGHDYEEADWPGVVKAVHEAFGPVPAIGKAAYCWGVTL